MSGLPASQGLPLTCPLDETPMGLTKILPFWLELTHLALAQEPQNAPSLSLIKAGTLVVLLSPSLSLSLSLSAPSGPSFGPPEMFLVLHPGPVSHKLLCFNFSCAVEPGSPSSTLYSSSQMLTKSKRHGFQAVP